jgi:hypothetical protein
MVITNDPNTAVPAETTSAPPVTSMKDTVNDEVVGQALQRLMPELKAIPTEDLVQIQLDVPTVVATVLGSLPEIRAMRPEIEAKMKDFDLASFDKLEDVALALSEAHVEFLTATKPMDDLDKLLEEGNRLREKFAADANALVLHGIFERETLAGLEGGVGFKNLATDLSIYWKVFTQHWTEIQGKVGTTAADVERAGKLGQRIIRVVGLREQAAQAILEATDIRLRAYTLLLRVYDVVRQAAAFLRWSQRDAEDIAPSLFAGKQRRKAAPAVADHPISPPPGVVSPGNPTAVQGANTAATHPGQQVPDPPRDPSAQQRTLPQAAAPNAEGPIPGGDPFIS